MIIFYITIQFLFTAHHKNIHIIKPSNRSLKASKWQLMHDNRYKTRKMTDSENNRNKYIYVNKKSC